MRVKQAIGAFGIVAACALLVHRCDDATTTRAGQEPISAAQTSEAEALARTSHDRVEGRRRVARPADDEPRPIRTLRFRESPDEPADLSEIRRQLWSNLEKFAHDYQLTDQQFQAFLNDVADVAQAQRGGQAALDDLPRSERSRVREEQGLELELRLEAYFTEEQMQGFRFEFSPSGLVGQVRQLDLLEETP